MPRGIAALIFTASCASDDYVELYRTEPHAPSFTDSGIASLDHMGAIIVDQGVNFAVYSEHAEAVDLLLFVDPEASLPTRWFNMHRFGDVWSLYVEGAGVGLTYGLVAWGPNWRWHPDWYPGSIYGFAADVDATGNRFNPNKLLFDPYARALHRDHDWSKGSLASGPKRSESTFAAAAKSVVTKSEYAWSGHETMWRQGRRDPNWAGHRYHDLVIYEVHPKGFTADPASRVQHPGTYRGLGEKAAYLADLGITAVELMPVHEKPLDGGYWGYQTLGFFMPEQSYATQAARARPGGVIDEFKWMVDELHQHGIEVILDVVYNHTGEGGLWREKIELDDVSLDPATDAQLINFDAKEVAGLYAFRGLDNQAYYALTPDGQLYWNNTGVGNQTRPNHRPMRRLILDSLAYWIDEMHIDGFRFDLAPILGERDLDYNVWDDPTNTVLQEIIDHPLVNTYNVRIIAEPWSIAGFYLGQFPVASTRPGVGWYEWSAHFRDWWRSFTNDDGYVLNRREGPIDGGATLTGSAALFAASLRRPHHSVNFVTIHDGFTLYDVFSFDTKQNLCGPLNPVCCDQPNSPFCDRDSGENYNRSRDWTVGDDPGTPTVDEHALAEAFKRQLMRNLMTATLIAHGTPMLLGGDEWMRTQLGNNNAYSSGADNPYNWFDWGVWEPQAERQRMFDFVRQMIRLRKEHAYALAPADYAAGAPFAWKSAAGADMQLSDWSGKSVAMHYYDPGFGPELYIMVNMAPGWVSFTLPSGRSWQRLVDTQAYFDLPDYFITTLAPAQISANITLDAPVSVPGAIYDTPGRSIVILRAE